MTATTDKTGSRPRSRAAGRTAPAVRGRARARIAAVALLAACASCGPDRSGEFKAFSPPRGGTLRLVQEEIHTLDPVASTSVYESLALNQVFDGLVDLDGGLSIVPSLASSWAISRDGRTYTFRLRPGVRFHDGTPLTAQDVIFSFERLMSPERRQRNVACEYFSWIEGAREFAAGKRPRLSGIEAVDASTVRIRLEQSYPSFLEVLAMDGARIVPRDTVLRMGNEAFGRAPVGTGPFRLEAWEARGLALVANRDYFAEVPRLDRVEIRFLEGSESDQGASRLERGEVDLVEVQAEHFARLSGDPRLKLYRYQELSLTLLGLNTGAAPLNQAGVRRAIAHAVDRGSLVAESEALRRDASGILPPGVTGYLPGSRALPHDPALARRLLSQAGYPGGRGIPPIELYSVANNASSASAVRRIAESLAAAGIAVRPKFVSWSELNRRIDTRTAPMFLLTWVADLTDPDYFLRSLFQSHGPANYFDLADRETDALLREGAVETHPLVRARIYQKVERRVLALAPIVPLYHSMGVLASRRDIHGLEPGPLGLTKISLEKVWLGRPGDAT